MAVKHSIKKRSMGGTAAKEDWRLRKLTSLCLAMPEASRQLLGRHAGFYIRKKTFAYFLDDHHGYGIVSVTCKVLPGDNTALVASDPARFYMPAYVASKGWVGLRLDVGEVDWEEAKELVTHSYLLIAPKRLAAEWRRVNEVVANVDG
jgi:predicted DNA-binding protein (MmcQ/YjbR family)